MNAPGGQKIDNINGGKNGHKCKPRRADSGIAPKRTERN
jgi:hypothetical protein